MSYTIRKKCIFCNNLLQTSYFEKDLMINSGLYCVDLDYKNDTKIPYNIFICNRCKTVQNKYLGDLNLVYLYGHNEGIGKLYKEMHQNFANLILENKNIENIIEIGGSVGTLSNIIMNNSDINYTIVEPNCTLTENKKLKIHKKFVEDCDESIFSNNDTLVMSHILEHFYSPLSVLNQIINNSKINNFYLTWPDFDYYIENNILNILTIEHTFYIDLNFLEKLLKNNFGFILKRKIFFKNHSIFLYFKRETSLILDNTLLINNNSEILINNNSELKIKLFYQKINNTIEKINSITNKYKGRKKYLWPCSIHNLFLLKFDKFNIDNIDGFIDNSKNKIGKRVYASDKLCYSFDDVLLENDNNIILLNGGPFNYEIINLYKNINNNIIII